MWGGGAQTFDHALRQQLCCGHKPTTHLGGGGGLGGMLTQIIFGNLDSLRVFLRHSDCYFGAAIFT